MQIGIIGPGRTGANMVRRLMNTDMVEAVWKAVGPILDGWSNNPPKDFLNYTPGEWGASATDRLMKQDNHEWWTEKANGGV